MNETQGSPEAPQGETGSFFSNLFDLYLEPRAAFERILRKPRALVAIVLYTAMTLGFFSFWMQRMDPRVFIKNMLLQSPRADRMSSEQIEQIVDMQAKGMPTWGRVSSTVSPLLGSVLIGGVLLFIFRFFMAADVNFKQSFAIVTWSFLALGVVTTPLTALIMQLKNDWNLNPQDVLQANPTAFFEAGTLSRHMGAFLGSFDLFSFWLIFLLATGYAVASKRPLSSGLWGVGIPWALIVLVKVGWQFLF